MGTQQAPARAKARGEHGTAWVAAQREAGEKERECPASRDAPEARARGARGMPVLANGFRQTKKRNHCCFVGVWVFERR